ncbi:MAG: GGDEF domain-containing protein [Cyanobacteria bacterium J06621_8]
MPLAILIKHNFLAVLNLILAGGALWYGVSVLTSLQFQLQKKAVSFFLLGVLLLAIAEVLMIVEPASQSSEVELLQELIKTSLIVSISIALFFIKQSEQKEISQLRDAAFLDGLTQLYNQSFFRQAARQKLLEARRNNQPLSILMLDIDDFKAYNDKFGHEAGNFALRYFAQELGRITRSSDLVARYGGEEFIILVNSDIEEAVNLAQRICQRIATVCLPKYNANLHRSITVSIGLAPLTANMTSLEELIATADHELYKAKQMGKNCVHYRAAITR